MINILVAGDFSPRENLNNLIVSGNYNDAFNEIKDLNNRMDYSVVNFESTVTNDTCCPIEKNGPNLKCTPKSISFLKWAGFDMLTLANNHFFDYGDCGVCESLKIIKENGMDYVGAGYNLTTASKTLFKKIKGSVFAFINCCEHEFSIATNNRGGCNPLNPISQYYAIKQAREKADYVVVIVHGGHEHYQLPSTRMQEAYRFFVDSGADAVVNHHQHCYSGYEFYESKPIVYGLGNFCFDNEREMPPTWYEGYAVQLIFNQNKIDIQLHPYVQCKDDLSVKFLINQEEFEKQIRALNSIILEEDKLRQANENYYASQLKDSIKPFLPYKGRILNALYNRGILPCVLNHKKEYLQNKILCESHLDILQYCIKNI